MVLSTSSSSPQHTHTHLSHWRALMRSAPTRRSPILACHRDDCASLSYRSPIALSNVCKKTHNHAHTILKKRVAQRAVKSAEEPTPRCKRSVTKGVFRLAGKKRYCVARAHVVTQNNYNTHRKHTHVLVGGKIMPLNCRERENCRAITVDIGTLSTVKRTL